MIFFFYLDGIWLHFWSKSDIGFWLLLEEEQNSHYILLHRLPHRRLCKEQTNSSKTEGQVPVALSIFRSACRGPPAIIIQKNIHTRIPRPSSNRFRQAVLMCRYSLPLGAAWLTLVLLMLNCSQTFSKLQTLEKLCPSYSHHKNTRKRHAV